MQPEADIPKTLAGLMELAPAGFAIALHVRFATPSYLFQTYPPAWIEEYGRAGLVMVDPTVAWGFSNVGRISWDELSALDSGRVLERARLHGLVYGLTVSLERGGSRSIASFSRQDRDFSPDEIAEIQATVDQLHDGTASAQSLSADAREMLKRLSVAYTHP